MRSFPLGTLITIGKTPRLRDSALGIVFRVDKIVIEGKKYSGKVMKNPNGWHAESIRHSYTEGVDTYQLPSNSQSKYLLKGVPNGYEE